MSVSDRTGELLASVELLVTQGQAYEPSLIDVALALRSGVPGHDAKEFHLWQSIGCRRWAGRIF